MIQIKSVYPNRYIINIYILKDKNNFKKLMTKDYMIQMKEESFNYMTSYYNFENTNKLNL